MKVKPNINTSSNSNHVFSYAFKYACESSRLEIAKWLLQVKPDINISDQDEYVFKNACTYNDLEIAKWFMELDYEKYYVRIFNDSIIEWSILDYNKIKK